MRAAPPAPSIRDQLREELSRWEAAGLRRSLDPPQGRDFTTNDYLGLSRHPRVLAAAHDALERWGAGAGAARLLRGHLPVHAAAEEAAAEWLGAEAALLFPSGWQANLAALSALAERGDLLLSDELNHASLIEGCRASHARATVFAHADPADLERALRAGAGARRRIVVTESVFSMDGDRAPLQEYARLAERHDAWLYVDEAHAAGLYGPGGAGLAAELADAGRVLARMITGGKALGVCGGFVAGSRETVDWLLNRGRAFVFTTAPTPATAAALAAAIETLRGQPELAERAHAAAARLRQRLAAAGLETRGESPIVPVVLGAPERAVAAAAELREHGFDVRAVRPPTVPPGTSRLRIVCHADHAAEEVDALAAALAAAARRPGLPSAAPVRPRPEGPPRGLVVAGTDTGVGKTVVSALLARAAARRGVSAGYLKPVQTGSDSDTETVRRLAALAAGSAPDPCVALPLPASVDQAADAAGRRVTVAELHAAAVAALASAPGRDWVVETAGGLLVPFNEGEDQADLLRALGLPLVLVARSGLGTLNHTRLTLEAAALRGLVVRALFLVGEPHAANVATLRRWCAPLPLYELPRLDPLDGAALDGWLEQNPLEALVS